MKKFFLILFIVSFLAGSVWAWNDQKSATVDHSSVPTASEMTRATGWFDYFDVADATSLTWATPERATLFEIWDFCLEAPVSIDTVSAYFYEHADYLWPDSTFSFKIYAADGTTLLGDSGPLEAVPPAINTFFEVGYVFSPAIAITGDFYLVVAPVDASGHPSTAGTNLYDGQSYTGDATAGWVLYPSMTYFMSAHMIGADTGERLAVTPETGAFGVVPLGNTTTQTFVIENYCPTGTITLNPAPALTGDAVFTITGDTGATYPTILPTDQATVEIEVTFAPIAGVPYTGTLEVYDNLTRATTQIPLTGNGLDPDCEWYVVAFDDYADGWSTGYIEIFFDDVMMYHWSGPVAGGPDTLSFGIVEGVDIDITHVGDTWGYENSYYVYNNFDNLVGSDGVGGVDPVGINDLYGTCIIPPCGFPVDLVTESISATTATLKWSAGPDAEVMWDVIWGDPGFDPLLAGTLISGLSDTTTVLSGLTHSTGYDWYVRADCGASLVSGWGAGESFFTPPPNDGCQGAINVGEVDSLYFDTTPASISGQGSWVSGSDMWYKYTPTGTGTATFDLCGSDFDTMMGIYSGSCLGLTLIEGNDDATYCDARALQSAVLDVPVVLHNSYYIQLGGWSTSVGTGDLTITLNECPDPTDQVVTNLTQTTADLGWTENGLTLNWHVELGTLGFTPTGIPTHTSVTNPLLLTGLTPATDYAWYVVSDCGVVRDSSNWVGPNTFTTLEACPVPTALAVLNITTTTATLDWDTMPGAIGYDWEVVLRDSAQGHGVVDSGNLQHSTIDIISLTSNTLYDFRVQSVCLDRAVSGWSAPYSFGTPCDTFTAPTLEGFEGGVFPDCWAQETTDDFDWTVHTGSTVSSGTGPSAANEGSYYIYTETSGPGNSSVATFYSPVIDLSALTVPELAFAYHMYGAGMEPDGSITVGVSDNGGAFTNIFTEIGDHGDVWNLFNYDLSGFTGPIQLSFTGTVSSTGTNYTNDFAIDDIQVRETPTCPDPTVLVTTNETASGADLGWTSVDSFFDIYIVPMGDPAPLPAATPTVDDNAGTSYTWTGGMAATAYDWYVRADCDAAGVSNWVGPASFVTLCDLITTFPYNESFESTLFAPLCWDNVQLNGTGTQLWNRETVGTTPTCSPIDGAAMAEFNCYSFSSGVSALLRSPGFTFPDDQYRVRFNMYRDTGYASNAELVDVYYNTTPDTTGATLLGTVHRSTTLAPIVATEGWYEYVFDVPAGTSGTGFIGLVGVSAFGNNMFIDNVTIEAIPSLPVFGITPDTMDFGTVYVNNSTGNQTFTISNLGVGTINVSSVSLTGTDAAEFTLIDTNLAYYPIAITTNTMVVDVAFLPTSAGVKNAFLTVVDDLARSSHNIPLTGEGAIPVQGVVCSNPLPLTLPAVNVLGNTGNYGDDYNSVDISPASSYLNGDDVVYQFTTTEDAIISGSIVTTGSWMGAFILADCPNPTTPPTPILQKTTSGTTLTYDDVLPAGTYFLIISTWPTPQAIDYDITLSVAPLAVPVNVVIVNDGTNVTITWDAVTGADSYVVYSSTNPIGAFAVDATGVFTAEQWVAPSPAVATFYNVAAVKAASRFTAPALTSEEIRKLELENTQQRGRK